MKVYVDKLPKSCEECPFRYYECDSYWCAGYSGSMVLFADEVKEENLCPLKSLAEHDRAVKQHAYKKGYNDMRLQYELGGYKKRLVKEVIDKIKTVGSSYSLGIYIGNENLEEIEKELLEKVGE